jgi:hypothetical protein
MNINDLIKLARKADLDGDIELADYLDKQLIRVSQNIFQRGLRAVGDFFNKQTLPKYNVDFKSLAPDASDLDLIAGHPTQRGNAAQKFFQAGLKNIERSPERLVEIGDQIKGAVKNVISQDPDVRAAAVKFNTNQPLSTAERNALLNHLVNTDQIAKRNNDISPDDIVKVLSGKTPDVPSKQVTTLSNAGKTGIGLGTAATLGTGYGMYNASKQQAVVPPGGLYNSNPSTGPFQEMPEMGGGMPTQQMQMAGEQGGYQGPKYNMPNADQSFQPMQGYQPANQVRDLPRTNDQAEPLYPRITPQQTMQNAMTEDQARRYRELMEQGGRPAVVPVVGENQEVYGPTQEMVNPGGVSYSQQPTQTEYMPAAPVTEGTNDPNANVIYTPQTQPRTDNYQYT